MDLLHPAPAVPQAVLLSEPLDTPKVIPFGKTVKASNPLSGYGLNVVYPKRTWLRAEIRHLCCHE
jgi:hypothetical protein